jgi:dTDP-4-amino-4,6-dideoxygalactose transaminase
MIRSLGNYGSSRHYVFDHVGRNSRIDELQAAVLCAKLKHLDHDNNRRKQIANRYMTEIANPLVVLPSPCDSNVYHIFPVLCQQRDALKQHLQDCGIDTMIHYPIPPHRQLCYNQLNHLSLPLTEMIHQQELSIPCNQAMTDDEVSQVIAAINNFQL